MISEYEHYVVEAIINFYNYDYTMFFEFLDEGILWYGPKENQFIVGKDNLIRSLENRKKDIRFSVDDIKTRLLPFSANTYTLIISYTLKAYHPDRTTETYLQRVLINAMRLRDKDGKIFWKCPIIHVADIIKDKDNSNKEKTEVFPENFYNLPEDNNLHLALPGDNHSTVYVSSDSIKFISGGKGVMCYVHTDKDVFLIRMLLKDIIKLLPDNFYRCHSSYIVNMKQIVYLSSKKITLRDKTEIPVSSRRISEIKQDINNWMTSK